MLGVKLHAVVPARKTGVGAGFEVRENQSSVLIGETGSGKTTQAACIVSVPHDVLDTPIPAGSGAWEWEDCRNATEKSGRHEHLDCNEHKACLSQGVAARVAQAHPLQSLSSRSQEMDVELGQEVGLGARRSCVWSMCCKVSHPLRRYDQRRDMFEVHDGWHAAA